MHSRCSFAHLLTVLFSSCCLVASLGRQMIFRLCTRGDALGQWQIHRNAVRMGLGAHMPCLETIMSPQVQMPAFERLKNCPGCLVKPHSWTSLAPPLAPGFPSLCCLWENVFRIFPQQDVGQRQLKLIQLLQSCFCLYPSGTRVVIHRTHSDTESWFLGFFFKFLPESCFLAGSVP